jgi:hypothetical protein
MEFYHKMGADNHEYDLKVAAIKQDVQNQIDAS